MSRRPGRRGRIAASLVAAAGLLTGPLVVDAAPADADRLDGHAPGPVEERYDQRGPWTDVTSVETDADTIVYPARLGTNARLDWWELGDHTYRHPILVFGVGSWGNPAVYAPMLEYWASWGYVVIAPNVPHTGSGLEMWDAAQYLIPANDDPASAFHQKLDTTKIAAGGHSQGAGGALWATLHSQGAITATFTLALPDKRWSTDPLWQEAARGISEFLGLPPPPEVPVPDVSQVAGPVFLIKGSEDRILDFWIASEEDHVVWFDEMGGPAFKASIVGEGHLFDQVPQVPATAYVAAWLDYTLLDDPHGCRLFVAADGEDAELYGHPLLENLDQKSLPDCAPLEPEEPEPFESCEAPCSLDQVVEFDVVGAPLSMGQAGATVALEAVTLEGAPQATGGVLAEVAVTDRRGDGAGWSLTGQVTDFTQDAELGPCPAGDPDPSEPRCIPGDNLGWAPVAAVDHDLVPGDVAAVDPGASLDGGLGSAARSLCASPSTRSGGTFSCGAVLDLVIPASAAVGAYTATLTLTLA